VYLGLTLFSYSRLEAFVQRPKVAKRVVVMLGAGASVDIYIYI